MRAQVGDRLILEGIHVGGTPPYTVRWLDNGHEALVFPGSEARIEPPTTLDRS